MGVELVGMPQAKAWADGLERDVPKAVVRQLQTQEARPLAAAIKSRAGAYGKLASIAASSVTVANIADGAQIRGGGGGLAGILFGGAEYGGRRKRTTYARRSRKGRAHVVHKRRTTMMFLPHIGSRGYFFWPSVRTKTRGIVERTTRTIEQAAGRG